MIGVLISLAVTVLVVWILLKKMKAQFVLFFGGLVLLVSALAMDALGLLPNGVRFFPRVFRARASWALTSLNASPP